MESALTGPSIFNFLKPTDDKVISDQIRLLLDKSPLKVDGNPEFCKQCLTELRSARNQGILQNGQIPPSDLVTQTRTWMQISNPQAALDAEWSFILQIALKLQQTNFRNLAKLLKVRPGNGSPILASAVRYFFHREIETNQSLFQGLAFAKLQDIGDRQNAFLGAMSTLLEQHGQRFAQVMDEALAKLGIIELKMDALLDLQKRAIALLEKVQLQNREVRPVDSFSIRNDTERQLVKKLITEYRSNPEAQRRQLPELLNDVGKLEVATGDFAQAQQDFNTVATLAVAPSAKAEAYFNSYHAALEQHNWSEALTSLKEAVALDEQRFSPFPFRRFEPERILGAGGFGVVFLCKDRYLQSHRVVKSIRTSDLDRAVTDVFAEAATLHQMNHPGIIQINHCDFADSTGTRPYLVMEYFDGLNLESYVETEGLLALPDLLAIARPIAEALLSAHSRGILHRDVKPANILVRREGDSWQVKLIDFGLAIQPASFEGKASTQGPTEKTIATKSIAGTLHYAAPEQIGELPGVSPGVHSDVYGFGKLCYYALFQTPDPDDQEKEKLPAEWRKFLSCCTAQKLAYRLPDFTTVLAQLRDLPCSNKGELDGEKTLVERKIDLHLIPDTIFYLKSRGVTARAYESGSEFVVLAGSQSFPNAVPSLNDSFVEIRMKLLNEGIMAKEGEYLVFCQDHVFASPSAAASAILGRNSNGRLEWKDADGRTLKAIQNAGKSPAEIVSSTLRKIEKRIARIEQFNVVISYYGQELSLPTYDYERAANKDFTVAQWRDLRFLRYYPDCAIKVLFEDGSEAHGATRLDTVRRSYL